MVKVVATFIVGDMAITGVATIGDGGMVVAARAMVVVSGIGRAGAGISGARGESRCEGPRRPFYVHQ
jgi:hypothetical protein